MTLALVQGASQRLGHPLAYSAAFSSSLLADLPNQRDWQFDRKNPFGFWNRQRPLSSLGLLKITIGLAA